MIDSFILTALFDCSVFIGVSDREKERGNQRQMKETQRITEDLQNYNDWLRIAGWYIVCADVYFAVEFSLLVRWWIIPVTLTVWSYLISCYIMHKSLW